MFINMELYRIFYFTAKNGNLSRAAKELFITQSAVSQSIKQLEERLGTKLFFRTQKGVTLTGDGKLLFEYIEQSYTLITQAEKKILEINNLKDGEIRIGIGDTLCKYYLLNYITMFNRLYPNIRLKIFNITTMEIVESLKMGKIDFGVITLPMEIPSNLKVVECLSINDCFIVGNRYKHLSKKRLSLKDLSKFPLILLDKTSNSRKCIDDFFMENDLKVTPEFELGNIDLLIEFTKVGLGIGCVIENFIKNEVEEKSLYKLNLSKKPPKRKIGMVVSKNIPLSRATQQFISLIYEKEANMPFEFSNKKKKNKKTPY